MKPQFRDFVDDLIRELWVTANALHHAASHPGAFEACGVRRCYRARLVIEDADAELGVERPQAILLTEERAYTAVNNKVQLW